MPTDNRIIAHRGQSPNGSDLSMGLDKLLKPIMRKSLAGIRKALTKPRRIGW